MTIEFMAMLPVIIVIACIAVNAMTFFSECAAFDVQAKNAIRMYAASPGYGQDSRAVTGQIVASLRESFKGDALTVAVDSHRDGEGMIAYDATLEYAPNLFGLGLKRSVLGVSLPRLRHTSTLTVSPYKPGMLF